GAPKPKRRIDCATSRAAWSLRRGFFTHGRRLSRWTHSAAGSEIRSGRMTFRAALFLARSALAYVPPPDHPDDSRGHRHRVSHDSERVTLGFIERDHDGHGTCQPGARAAEGVGGDHRHPSRSLAATPPANPAAKWSKCEIRRPHSRARRFGPCSMSTVRVWVLSLAMGSSAGVRPVHMRPRGRALLEGSHPDGAESVSECPRTSNPTSSAKPS